LPYVTPLAVPEHTRSPSLLQWEAIPDIGDYTVKKQKHLDRFTPVPDSLLAGAAGRDATATAIDAQGPGGLETPMGGATTDLTAMGAGRNTVVQLKLDKISDSVSGQTVVDPKGYLTDLKSVTLKSGGWVGRRLLGAVW
jgi:pre-mRNA-processing factor 6